MFASQEELCSMGMVGWLASYLFRQSVFCYPRK